MLEPKGFKRLGDRAYTIADELLTAIEDGHSIEQIQVMINMYLLAMDKEKNITLNIERGY